MLIITIITTATFRMMHCDDAVGGTKEDHIVGKNIIRPINTTWPDGRPTGAMPNGHYTQKGIWPKSQR